MTKNSNSAHAPAARPTGGPGHGGASAWATWTIGGAAFVVILAAGALMLAKPPGKTPAAEPERSPAPPQIQSAQSINDLAPKNPLDITASLLDAQERSRLWNASAMLARIELIVVDGKPAGPIIFEFGVSRGNPVPQAELTASRYSVTYEANKASATSFEDTQTRIALADPNCPLEIAFSKFRQVDGTQSKRVGILYAQSAKHQRAAWLMTTDQGESFSLSGENCSLLRR